MASSRMIFMTIFCFDLCARSVSFSNWRKSRSTSSWSRFRTAMASILETSWTQSVHPELDAPARPLAPANGGGSGLRSSLRRAPGHLRRWRLVVALRFRERATDRAVGQNAGELIGSEPIPQLDRGERRTWEHNPGGDLGQRHQGERAGLEQRMRELESGLFHHPAAVQQEVEVDLARSPALAADPS